MVQHTSKAISITDQFRAVLRLIAKYFFKSPSGIFFSLGFPIMIYGILGSVMGYKEMIPPVMAVIGGTMGIQLVPFAVVELKKSVLLKRIGASPVKPAMFTYVVIFFFLITTMISTIWLILWALVFTQDTGIFDGIAKAKGFFQFFFGLTLNIVMSVTVGFAIASVSKSEMQAQAIAMSIYFPIAFLSGQFLAPATIANSAGMEWISRFIPFRYTTMMMSEAWYGDKHAVIPIGSDMIKVVTDADIFSVHDYYTLHSVEFKPSKAPFTQADITETLKGMKVLVYDKADHITSFVAPYAFIGLMTGFSIKKFKWSAGR